MDDADYYWNSTAVYEEEKVLRRELGILCSNLTGADAWTNSDNSTASSLAPSSGESVTSGYLIQISGIYIALLLTMAVLGLTVNILSIFIIALGSHVGKNIRIKLVNLAIADFLTAVGLLVIFSGLYSFIGTVGLIVYWTALQASLLCNMDISLERFVLIMFPFRAQKYKRVHRCIVTGLIWLFATLGSIPLIFKIVNSLPVWLYITQLVLYYAVPSVIITIANIGILIKLKDRTKIKQKYCIQQTIHTYRNLKKIPRPEDKFLRAIPLRVSSMLVNCNSSINM